MNRSKRENIYRVIMLVILSVVITFVTTTLFMYKYMGESIRYIKISSKEEGLVSTLESFRKIVDEKFLGEIDEEKITSETIKGYIKGLDDPYSEYMTREEMQDFTTDVMGNFIGIGVYLTNDTEKDAILIISPIKDSPAAKAGILPGDIVTEIDGVSYTGKDLTEASNKIRGEIGTKVKLGILRENKTIELEITRENIKINHVESKVLSNNIGYVEFNSFDEGCSEEFKQNLEDLKRKGIKSLIIDIRNNGGGLVKEATKIADFFTKKDEVLLITVDKKGEEEITKSEEDSIIDVPVVILTNGNSASASEILAGALKDDINATIIGETTYGKGVIQELLKLTDGSGLKITTNEYYTPKRNKINEVGIVPNIEVVANKELEEQLVVEESQDNQLQRAIEFLKTGK